MKLWLKISIICIVVLLVIVIVCSALLLIQSKNSILDLTTQHAKDKHKSLLNAFSSMAKYYVSEEMGDAAKYSVIKYCFSRFADETGVLIRDEETIVSQVTIDPKKILPLPYDALQKRGDEPLLYTGEIEERNMLIIGNTTHVWGTTYSIYVVEDITTAYNQIIQMMWQFALISAAGIIIGTVLIMIFVRRASRPLRRLGMATRQIAKGDYSKRTDVHTHDEVGSLAEDFNHMADAVESHVEDLTETAQRQQLFIGGVTHEFKTPLTSMLIHSDTLLNTKMNEEDKARSLAHIHGQCRWLERLIQKLLKLVTLKQDIALRDEPVAALFDAVYDSMHELLDERGTPLVLACGTNTLPMDFDLMRSLIINLVDNASKASAPGQCIRLCAYDNVIAVRDTGRGIPKEELTRITEPFYMVDRSRSKRKGGSGLGLALAKQIADAHHARLVIESVPDCGTRVKVIFTSSG